MTKKNPSGNPLIPKEKRAKPRGRKKDNRHPDEILYDEGKIDLGKAAREISADPYKTTPQTPKPLTEKELREKLADLCHSQWSGWMAYLFSKSNKSSDGTCIIPKEYMDRWTRQTDTAYEHLSENEKNSDREEADKFIALIEKAGPMQAREKILRDAINEAVHYLDTQADLGSAEFKLRDDLIQAIKQADAVKDGPQVDMSQVKSDPKNKTISGIKLDVPFMGIE